MGNQAIFPINEPKYLKDVLQVEFLYQVETNPPQNIYKILYINNKTCEMSLDESDLQYLQQKGIKIIK